MSLDRFFPSVVAQSGPHCLYMSATPLGRDDDARWRTRTVPQMRRGVSQTKCFHLRLGLQRARLSNPNPRRHARSSLLIADQLSTRARRYVSQKLLP
eukprot:scaffold181301_cov28-Tisochrysis_lutea.AAC.4